MHHLWRKKTSEYAKQKSKLGIGSIFVIANFLQTRARFIPGYRVPKQVGKTIKTSEKLTLMTLLFQKKIF